MNIELEKVEQAPALYTDFGWWLHRWSVMKGMDEAERIKKPKNMAAEGLEP